MFRLEQSGQYMGRLWAMLGHMKGMQQGITRTLQGLHCRWAHPHTLPQLNGTPSSAPHTLRRKLRPTIPSQACCSCVVSRKVILEQQGVQQTRAAPQQGRWHRPVYYPDGTEHTCPWPQAVPREALPSDWTGTDLAQQRVPSTLPSLSQSTRQAVHIKDMQHINNN